MLVIFVRTGTISALVVDISVMVFSELDVSVKIVDVVSKGGVGILIVLFEIGSSSIVVDWTIGALSGTRDDKIVVNSGVSMFVIELAGISSSRGRDGWVDVKTGGLGNVDGIIGLISLVLTLVVFI